EIQPAALLPLPHCRGPTGPSQDVGMPLYLLSYGLPPCFHFLIAGGLPALLKVGDTACRPASTSSLQGAYRPFSRRYGLPPCFHFLIAGGLPALLKVGM
ncbi:unnamed protein product, partial [Closterium sp. Naga37s-1]